MSSDCINITLATEDDLSVSIVTKIFKALPRKFSICQLLPLRGNSYLKERIENFNLYAKHNPILVLTDLDAVECPPILIKGWLKYDKNANMIFRVAVREVESWVIAHREALAEFFQISLATIPRNPDELSNPKETIINLAKRSPKRIIREDIVPNEKTTAKVGRNYNGRLRVFIESSWDPIKAKLISQSLSDAIDSLVRFEPTTK
jgi:hypothetical protein